MHGTTNGQAINLGIFIPADYELFDKNTTILFETNATIHRIALRKIHNSKPGETNHKTDHNKNRTNNKIVRKNAIIMGAIMRMFSDTGQVVGDKTVIILNQLVNRHRYHKLAKVR